MIEKKKYRETWSSFEDLGRFFKTPQGSDLRKLVKRIKQTNKRGVPECQQRKGLNTERNQMKEKKKKRNQMKASMSKQLCEFPLDIIYYYTYQ